jgi:hypothetical protein
MQNQRRQQQQKQQQRWRNAGGRGCGVGFIFLKTPRKNRKTKLIRGLFVVDGRKPTTTN